MGIVVYNTLTRKKEPFTPVTPGKVGIYLCGPTVYKPSHIGHAVGPIIFDAIKRYLVHRGYEVNWVVNITDVDDKLIVEAARQNTTTLELAERITKDYLAAMDTLHVDGIDIMPKASEHIGDIISIIERLMERGVAYQEGGDVYFDVTRHDGYGKLSNRRIEEQEGQRELQSGEKRNPGDFALWKGAKPDEPEEVKFESPWGQGRPGCRPKERRAAIPSPRIASCEASEEDRLPICLGTRCDDKAPVKRCKPAVRSDRQLDRTSPIE